MFKTICKFSEHFIIFVYTAILLLFCQKFQPGGKKESRVMYITEELSDLSTDYTEISRERSSTEREDTRFATKKYAANQS